MMDIKNKLILLTKIKSNLEQHPNGLEEGYQKKGIAINNPEVDNYLIISSVYKQMWTSTIISIDEENMTFKTANSTYKVELINNES